MHFPVYRHLVVKDLILEVKSKEFELEKEESKTRFISKAS